MSLSQCHILSSPHMVSALLNDALSNATAVIDGFMQNENISPIDNDFPTRVSEHFRAIFKDNDALKQIPPLAISHPPQLYRSKPHPLVRFRAMVQDTSASPEIYPAVLPSGSFGAWGLAESVGSSDLPNLHSLREREVLWAVSIPGESPFVAEYLDDVDLLVTEERDPQISKNPYTKKDPLMREDHVGLHVKLYDPALTSFKPAELYNFIGLLSFEETSEDDNAEISETPTLHVLFAEPLPLTLLSPQFPGNQLYDSAEIRAELIRWIADEALAGDPLAAEWIVLSIISRVHSRRPPIFPLSITLSSFPKCPVDAPAQVPALVHVLRLLLPLFAEMPLSLQVINTRPFTPESRDDTLYSGLLQLPAGTTVLVSDITMEEGKVNDAGIRNLQALGNAISLQTLDYRFPYASPYQFPTDLSFIVLTGGKASPFAETQINIPLKCDKPPSSVYKEVEVITLPTRDRLEAFRHILGTAKTGDVKVSEDISEYIQDDFVRERQVSKSTSADDLMGWMSIAKLMALSYQQAVLTKGLWDAAKDLDRQRKTRL